MVEFTRRKLMATSVAATLGASVSAASGVAQDEDADTPKAPHVKGEIKRFATTALGAEVTGPEVSANGTLFFSLQHPSRKNPAPFNKAGIGYVRGYNFSEGSEFDVLGVPTSKEAQGQVRVAGGTYELLAQEGDNIGGNGTLGMPVTPDDLAVEEYPGARYGNFGYNPDCNRLVPTNEAETRGYLFTNWEESPGNVTRIPVSRKGQGRWEADLENAVNLANTEALRSIGGTRINCYGDLSPWGTYLSAEEDYAHPRVALTTTVSDVVGDSEGPDHRGAAQFYNRPNPSDIQEAVEKYYGDDAWFVQGYWALAGLEIQAYYLGADAADENEELADDVDPETSLRPVGSPYPNPYRYGRIVDFRQPTAETPQPVKYHVMGRAAWECPDVQADEKTVYLTSDGDNKGLYKFVADQPIPSYDDPMNLSGTLYAANVTNQQAAADNPPAEVPLEVEWLEMGSATNAEVESWIAEYDDVDQVDYLETHADTDWQEDVQKALEEADKTVVQQGNQNYVPDEDVVRWARQYEQNGPSNVDEELRRVPFLETRAAAKEIGATVEFRKSEGIDSRDGAEPGDYVYVGVSEVNDGMSDEAGDVDLDRVDGGLVYRAELEDDYDISTLEPVIVGPDATDPADVANDALLNIDNVFVMDDGRVLCCEDADQYGRSFPNDCLYVYTPEEMTGGGEATETTPAEETTTATDAEGTTTTEEEATTTAGNQTTSG
ncbi:alkaline phosphatase PhoX [Halorussus aquaticus]|uniref:Alkaline phosphatase PhoX n=1 Tax=Halorussus aquaticus TaxID=2953748 RepID=A0ABD5PXP0_9EURY|nr:alkaline phosphatase PhoX [Halorussus aquaticus]